MTSSDTVECHVTFARLRRSAVPSSGDVEPDDATLSAVEALRPIVLAHAPLTLHAVTDELCFVHVDGAALLAYLRACASHLRAGADRGLVLRSATHHGPAVRLADTPIGVSGDHVDMGLHILDTVAGDASYLTRRAFDALPIAEQAALQLDAAATATIRARRPKLLEQIGSSVYRL